MTLGTWVCVHYCFQGGRITGNPGTRFPLNLGTRAKFWSRITCFVTKSGILDQNLAQLSNFLWLTNCGILNQNLAQHPNFLLPTKHGMSKNLAQSPNFLRLTKRGFKQNLAQLQNLRDGLNFGRESHAL